MTDRPRKDISDVEIVMEAMHAIGFACARISPAPDVNIELLTDPIREISLRLLERKDQS
jgi:hypothetical protein